MTAPVSDSPVEASLIKPLIVADLGGVFSENPLCKINDEKIKINKKEDDYIKIKEKYRRLTNE